MRVTLREFVPEDTVPWQRVAGDPRVAAAAPWPVLATLDATSAWIVETRRMAALKPRRSFYLVLEQYGDFTGCATLDVLSIPHRQGEISVYLRPDRWTEGLGRETARLLLELGFQRLGLHRIQATVDPQNIAARRMLEHVNMRHEGTLLDRYFVAGAWQDRALYSITLPEWRGEPRGITAAQSSDTESSGVPEDEESPTIDVTPDQLTTEPPVAEDYEDYEGYESYTDYSEYTEYDADEGRYAHGPAEQPQTAPQMLTAQIVMEQIEVVKILPHPMPPEE